MIALLATSAIFLTASQGVINAPRDAFKTCLKEATNKGPNDHITGDGFEAYVKSTCGAQLGALKGAVVKFDMGNKMSHAASVEDADAMVEDFMGSAVDNYRYRNKDVAPVKEASAPPPAATPTAVTPPPTPASAPKPPK